MNNEPRGAFTCRSSTLTFLADCGPFRGLSLFWGPGVISTINEPRGPFMRRSSTLTVLADFGPFLRLLLTILGSRSDFHDERTPGCIYMSVINTHNFGQFWPVSWTTQIRGPEVIFMINKLRGAFTCRSSTLALLADSVPFRGLLLSVLGSQSDFPGCVYVSVVNTHSFGQC